MEKYIIEYQRQLFSNIDEINSKSKIIKKKIKADYFMKSRDETIITEENISRTKILGDIYNVGDIFYGPFKKISFYKDGLETESYNIFADPRYKLYKVNWFGRKKLIDTYTKSKNK